jgi:hypothetical protein
LFLRVLLLLSYMKRSMIAILFIIETACITEKVRSIGGAAPEWGTGDMAIRTLQLSCALLS